MSNIFFKMNNAGFLKLFIFTYFITLFNSVLPLPYPLTPLLNDFNLGKNVLAFAELRHNRLRRDFVTTTSSSVNRRGKGSISRLSFEDGTDPLQLPDPDLSGGTATPHIASGDAEMKLEAPKFQPFKIVMPTNMRTHADVPNAPKMNNSSPSFQNEEMSKKLPEDFEKFTKILQEFLSRQHSTKKPMKKRIDMPKLLNISKIKTVDKDTNKNGNEQHGSSMEVPTTAEKSSNRGLHLSLLANATRGTVLGTVPVSLEIGHNGEEEDQDDVGMEQQQQLIADEQSGVEMIGHSPVERAEKNDKTLEQMDQEKEATTDQKSWDGSVEKVTTLKMSPSPSSPSSSTASVVVDQQMQQRSFQKQLFGRIIIEPHHRKNQTNGKIELDEPHHDQSFFYQVQDNGGGEGAHVEILREGFARQMDSVYAFVASITLIRDGGKTILVDTGMGTDINGRTDLIKKLSEHKIAPPAVDYVVVTHGHPDHAGNTNDFPDALHFQGVMSHYRTKFNFSNLFENAKHQLTDNVALISTPGHTSEDISVIITNALGYGTIVVSGDVFIAAEDLSRPIMWRPLAWNETVQEQSRQIILCLADYVVPGHGKIFHVTPQMRKEANCLKMTGIMET